MKLSKKGVQKIIDEVEIEVFLDDHGRDYMKVNLDEKEIEIEDSDFEFESDDSQGHVVMTVDEAKRLHDCAMFFWDDYEGTKYFTNDDKRFLTDMKERIGKSEKP